MPLELFTSSSVMKLVLAYGAASIGFLLRSARIDLTLLFKCYFKEDLEDSKFRIGELECCFSGVRIILL